MDHKCKRFSVIRPKGKKASRTVILSIIYHARAHGDTLDGHFSSVLGVVCASWRHNKVKSYAPPP